jgi:hypothetical protein
LKLALIDSLNDPFEFLGVASRDSNVRRQYRFLKDGFARYMGLLCFSENWRNPVQWSHYAERHRGICLGFDVSPTVELRKVVYVDERLKPSRSAMSRWWPEWGSQGGEEIAGELIVPCRDAPPVFDAAEEVFDLVAPAIEALGTHELVTDAARAASNLAMLTIGVDLSIRR